MRRSFIRSVLTTIAVLGLCTPALAQQEEALLIQDSAAWGHDAWVAELNIAGIPFTQINSADLASTDINDYEMVITVSVQGSTSNNRLLNQMADFETFVTMGGVLIWSACTQSGETPYPDPPFGGTDVYNTESYNVVTDPTHELMVGVGNPMYGTSASHNYLSGLPAGAEVLAEGQNSGEATVYVLEEGLGLLIASGLTWEHGWGYGYDAGTVLTNAVTWGWDNTVCDDVDGDGWGAADCGGFDCNDSDYTIYPGAEEICDDGIDQNCDGVADELTDNDGDGLSQCDGDCDDSDPNVRPFAAEVCDGFDTDCDGLVDEDFDVDQDGWSLCDVPVDCDDTRADVYPLAAEVCDGVDNDCDGVIDEQTDDDGDGFTVCGGDCDDNNSDTWPGATEICDELDNDCDGVVPADETYDGDGDGFVECEDCNDADNAIWPGAQEVCNGIDDDCDNDIDEGLDGDGDGLSLCEGDCDDTDPDTYPGAPELCDEQHNDYYEQLAA